jgi:hypothetical protein
MRAGLSMLWGRFVRLSIGGLATSCSLVVDADALAQGCDASNKACDGRCVSKLDPEYGCGNASCQPCVLPNATSVCDATEQCAVAACFENHEDCDTQASNGCEVNLDTDMAHCGACDAAPCEVAGAHAACARGQCAIRKCQPGFKDCNRLDEDGCEFAYSPVEPPMDDAGQSSEAGTEAICPSPAGLVGAFFASDGGAFFTEAGPSELAAPSAQSAAEVEPPPSDSR